MPTKAASSARDNVPDPSASIAATNARTSAGEASRFVIFRPVRNISSTSWTDNSPDRSLSYFRKKRSSGREPHLALNAFRNLSCVFMSRGFLTVRLNRCVARLALVARRMVVLCCVVPRFCLCLALWVGRGGGVRTPVGRGQPCSARGSPLPEPKVDGSALQRLSGRLIVVVSRREMGEASRGRSDGSIGSCRDRHAPKGTGRGLLEAKIFGSACCPGYVGAGELRTASTLPHRRHAAGQLDFAAKPTRSAGRREL